MPNWRSAIEIIVEHEVVEFAKDPLFNKLIKEKWQNFGRRRYILRSLLPYVIYLIVFTFMVVLRCIEVRDIFERSRNGEMLDLSGGTLIASHSSVPLPCPLAHMCPFCTTGADACVAVCADSRAPRQRPLLSGATASCKTTGAAGPSSRSGRA